MKSSIPGTQTHRFFFGLGSNLRDRNQHLDFARAELSACFENIVESRRYETLPRYREDQPRFLNSVVAASGKYDPEEVLPMLNEIERRAGRDREASGPKGPRPLDIDILLVDDQVIHTRDLTVPHPRMYERKFVLLPLLELSPNAIDPHTRKPFVEFFTNLEDQGMYYYSLDEFETTWV